MSLILTAETTVYDRYAITNRFVASETAINVVQGNISLLVSESEIQTLKNGDKTMYSKMASLEIDLDSITASISSSEYKNINGLLTAVRINDAKISATPERIQSIVTSTYVSELGSITSMQSSITQMAGQIELKVNNNGVIASINNSGEAVTINANKIALTGNGIIELINTGTTTIKAAKISLEGLVTANKNFSIDTSGNVTANNGTFTGTVTTTSGALSSKLTSGALYFYYNSIQVGRFYPQTWTGTTTRGISLGASDGAYYMGFGKDDAVGSTSVCPFILNWGLNPSGYTEKMIIFSTPRFLTSANFNSSIHFENTYGIRNNGNYILYAYDGVTYVGTAGYRTQLLGTGYANGGTIATTSDRNKKHDILDVDERYEKLFDALVPRIFKYDNGQSDRLHTGFIAQEVREAVLNAGLTTPEFAAYVESPDTIITEIEVEDEVGGRSIKPHVTETGDVVRSLRYEEFISLNTYMIQKLKAEVKELKELLKRS